MTWDSVPWFVGGGAEHSPEVARLLAYAATSGSEGIVGVDDLKVVPLAVPGTSVRVLAGAALILNRSAGGSQQTYVARNISEDVKGIASSGPGGGRNDIVIAQVKDPFLAGEPWNDPQDVKVGPYIFTEILSNVPASAVVDKDAAAAYVASLGLSAIPLAGILLPANTATITTGIIRDFRQVARPRRQRLSLISGEPPVDQRLSAASFARWISTASWNVRIPSWATAAFVRMDVLNAIHYEANVVGNLGLFMGTTLAASTPYANAWNGASVRTNLAAANDFLLPASFRGTVQDFNLQATRSTPNGYLTTDAQTRVLLDIEFIERAV